MRIFAKIVEEKWGISWNAALNICARYERGNSIYFLSEYMPESSACGIDVISEIYAFLDLQKELDFLRIQARKILSLAEQYNEEVGEDISYCISKVEIDDIVAKFRINSQSKGRAAINNGLLELANLFEGDFQGDVSSEAAKFIDRSKGLDTEEQVIDGVVAILCDRIAFDSNARFLVRNITIHEGNFEISVKKKSPRLDKFAGNFGFSQISDDDLLFLQNAEKNKEVKLSVVSPVLYIIGALKHHFLYFPDSKTAYIVNRAISDAYNKFLATMAQNTTKEKLLNAAKQRVLREVSQQLRLSLQNKTLSRNILLISQNTESFIDIMVINSSGEILRISQEDVRNYPKAFNSGKIKITYEQWNAKEIVIAENIEHAKFLDEVVTITVNSFMQKPVVRKIKTTKLASPLLKNDFVKAQTKDLDKNLQNAYCSAITLIAPLNLIKEPPVLSAITQNLSINYIDEESLDRVIDQNFILLQLKQGIEIGQKGDEILTKLGLNFETLQNLRLAKEANSLRRKRDLIGVSTMSELLFEEISGFIIFPKSVNTLDKTLTHPQAFDLVYAISEAIGTTIEDMVRNEKKILAYVCKDEVEQKFIHENLAAQLKVGAKYASFATSLYLNKKGTDIRDVEVGSIVSGRVRDIAPFGVFVDINVQTDALLHISQVPPHLQNEIKVGEKIQVKVLDVDIKKRRIALSMKTQMQTSDLLRHFNGN